MSTARLALLIFAFVLAFPARAADVETTAKGLFHCYSQLFALQVFANVPLSNDEKAFEEKIRAEVRRITPKEKLPELLELVQSEKGDSVREIASGRLELPIAMEKKKELLQSCTPLVNQAARFPDAKEGPFSEQAQQE